MTKGRGGHRGGKPQNMRVNISLEQIGERGIIGLKQPRPLPE